MPMLRTWLREHQGKYPVFESRTLLYDYINNEVLAGKPVQYLEFGVFQGESIMYFAGINTDAASRFVGFNTFTGLPDKWRYRLFHTLDRKTFDTGGQVPETDDKRISFVKGLFQESLPPFLEDCRTSNQLVINIDCDLYSSTLYVLTSANRLIVPGTIIIFDEFSSVMHEFRALNDYCSSYMRNYEVLAATSGHGQIAIRMQ